MIKKWVLAAVAYLLLVVVGYGIYSSTVEPNEQQMDMKQEEQG
ncbi:hypothetical protein [Bacillus marasmi]|nr:hypothetical protein [Bacillus marasmi]